MAHEVPNPVPGSWSDAMTHRPQLVLDAASARGQALRAPADRPCSSGAAHSHAPRPVGLGPREDHRRATADTLTFVGYASITGTGYEMWDAYGPYTRSCPPALSPLRWPAPTWTSPRPAASGHPPHRPHDPRHAHLAEDDQGLLVTARLDPC